mmetsp:Transcript_2340/g.9492  ORF Transcript_2340/g.9492 Transcript_2340/m.9492 type:complete len:230 (+) Transcript_2340:424-1113(+)
MAVREHGAAPKSGIQEPQGRLRLLRGRVHQRKRRHRRRVRLRVQRFREQVVGHVQACAHGQDPEHALQAPVRARRRRRARCPRQVRRPDPPSVQLEQRVAPVQRGLLRGESGVHAGHPRGLVGGFSQGALRGHGVEHGRGHQIHQGVRARGEKLEPLAFKPERRQQGRPRHGSVRVLPARAAGVDREGPGAGDVRHAVQARVQRGRGVRGVGWREREPQRVRGDGRVDR